MADTFFALTCVCVSIFFIILLFHYYDGPTGLFSRNTVTNHAFELWFTENVLRKTLEIAFPKPEV